MSKSSIISDGITTNSIDETLITKIIPHFNNLDSIENFESNNNVYNKDLINSAFHFTYEKNIFYEKDIILMSQFYEKNLLIREIECVLDNNNYCSGFFSVLHQSKKEFMAN